MTKKILNTHRLRFQEKQEREWKRDKRAVPLLIVEEDPEKNAARGRKDLLLMGYCFHGLMRDYTF